ncbi:GNAT family N-acetyltransferase [Streptomyces alkaliphilus]|uniref:GNAT family N-acetyltransferase n=1 Tax=Streptomyces alkaliphilus TaxID=1472722 RepID=A0A7W3Y0Q8_9ACTN|nr:GNAT family protein [Streptomyces alkaliphilus]MBB0243507.1 GNAT family N-acetyltransferase [Streptomyces alkaliphilus]MQS06756.1 GNAT family N-acetyltransferase [Streptomyces alkaliphilus]
MNTEESGAPIAGRRIVLRRAVEEDAPAFREALATPEVARWWVWPNMTAELAAEDHTVLAVTFEDRVVGMVQWYEEPDPDYRHAGMDLFLHPDVHGQGLGGDTVRTMARWLIDVRGHHRLVIDPDARNTGAIAVYERCGFRRVGVLRRYWYDHVTGEWSDGMLLDLLAEELRD